MANCTKIAKEKIAEIGYFDEFWASPPETPSSKAGRITHSLHTRI